MTKTLTTILNPKYDENNRLDIDSYARFALATGVNYKKNNIIKTLQDEGYTEKEIDRFFEIYNKGL
jgi:hypothetical protein